jgi:hypothetical protein
MIENDIIVCVGMTCDNFEELKKMNIMISELHEKIWTKRLRWWHDDIVLT